MEQLSIFEAGRLAELETVIERGMQTFVDVGRALLEIRDSRLYRRDYGTFEDYTRERWGMERRHAYRLIDAADAVGNVSNWTQIQPTTESQARPLTSLEPDQQREAWARAVETAPGGRITAAHVQQVVDEIREEKRPVSYHISDDSYEWYTPAEYIEAARGLMGSIDLDPASSPQAQRVVMAGKYYTRDDDGLAQEWAGNIWMNPPYNMPLIEQFIDKVIEAYRDGAVTSAVVLTNNSTDTGWFHKLIEYPVCFTRGRIKFWNGNEILATRQGQAIFYLGENVALFSRLFGNFGAVLCKYDDK